MEKLVLECTTEQLMELTAIQLVNKLEESMRKNSIKHPSLAGSLSLLDGLNVTKKALMKMLCQATKAKIEDIPIITYPSLKKTAWIAKPPSNKGYYIFFDSVFYINYGDFMGLNIGAFTKSRMKGCLKLLLSTALGSDVWNPNPNDPDNPFTAEREDKREQIGLAHVFLRASYFIIAHELSHFLLGHLDSEEKLVSENLGYNSQKVYSASQIDEFAADIKAINLLNEAYKGHEEALLDVLLSCTFLFVYIDLITFAVECSHKCHAKTNYSDLKTHPKPLDRLDRIEGYIKSITPKHIWKTYAKSTMVEANMLKERHEKDVKAALECTIERLQQKHWKQS